MSLETWKAEFYPIPADQVSKADAIAHSLQKWIGLRDENQRKHGVQLLEQSPTLADDENILNIDATSCALCVHHMSDVYEDDFT